MVQGLVTYLFYEGERSEPRKKDMSPARGPSNINAVSRLFSPLVQPCSFILPNKCIGGGKVETEQSEL